MFRQWFAAHRPLVVTATSGSVLAALVVGVAIVSDGYTAQRFDLNDASVWVANGSEQAIGRANTEILELNTVISGEGNDIDVLQSGSTVLLVDTGNSKLDIVNAATSEIADSVPLPPGRPQVFLAGDSVVILARSTGELWIVALADLPTFDGIGPATLSLGSGAVASVDEAGVLVAYSASAGQVYTIEPSRSHTARATEVVAIPASTGLQISSVGGRWVILDPAARQLYLSGRTVDLTEFVAAGTGTLQWPSTAGDSVLIAEPSGVVTVPLEGGFPSVAVSGQSGQPARPFSSGDCRFAAWTSGAAWRECEGEQTTLALSGMEGTGLLGFRSNGGRLVLNDARSGASWAVQRTGELINNWDDLIVADEDEQEPQNNNEDIPPALEQVQLPPIAVDDELGARPGRASVLPVLLNDYDPNGDVLVIASINAPDEGVGRVDVINDRQQLQITLDEDAQGTVAFEYTLSDGRGGTATAMVEVEVRTADQNAAPKQVRTTKSIVGQGGRVTTQVLGDWIDPDGDAFYLEEATISPPDSVSARPEGTVVFTDSGEGVALKAVGLGVSDGEAIGSGTLTVTVRPDGEVPIIAEPFIVIVTAGQEVTVSPLDHVRGGSGTLRLNNVPVQPGVSITPSYEAGTFQFVSQQVATHYLEYAVTDGDQIATGLVRVDVVAPPDPNATPITIPKTVFVKTLRTERIDVAGTDIDPAGGVLVVTGITNLEAASGVSAEILEQRLVRVRLNAPLDGPVVFNYRISNGLAEAEGVITVIEIPIPAVMQPPVANDDSIVTRVGAAIDIPVLANDEHPDGEELTLVPVLPEPLADEAGLLFGSGKVLRYLAPAVPGNFTAVYEVRGPDGQAARARLRIAVREADPDTNNVPVPGSVTARALAGETVTIKIPLAGIDPDGDSVQLLGQETNPEKGSVVGVGPDFITYRAGDYSAGTDVFTYAVSDSLGARATGTVRIGISARLEGARNPVAVLDEVTVRPGVTVTVQVLANDSDPDGAELHVVSAQPNDAITVATIENDLVAITPPREPGSYGVIYAIENDAGGSSSNFVRVIVDPDAPLSFPIARDTVLTLTDVLDREAVEVDVLSRVFFADGDARDLALSVYPGYEDTARVTSTDRIRVTVTAANQIIPFKVTHPADPGIYSFAFIWVPGVDDAPPQLNRDAPPLTVVSGERLEIELGDHVLAVSGRQVRLTDSSLVRATHAAGEEFVVDQDTLEFTSADQYFGPASISFEVTDGQSATDPEGRKAVIVLPITVLPSENQPPVFGGGVLEFEPGQEKEIDLALLTNYPYPEDVSSLVFTVLAPLPDGFDYSLVGQTLTITAREEAVTGSSTAISIGVRDALSSGQPGQIELSVVPSTRPLARPADDVAVVQRGATTVIDVLANDNATNPFPSEPLRVVAIRGINGQLLPEGLQVSPSANNSRLTVLVSPSAAPGTAALQYRVADATNDPNRYVWGSVRISVQDVPQSVSNVHVTEFADRRLTVAWNTGGDNNSPITGYEVVLTSASSGSVVGRTNCTGALCEVATPGNGPANAVRISVVAINTIGRSEPAVMAGSTWSDVIPAAPTGLTSSPLDHGLRVSWTRPPGSGSDITTYVISVEGAPAQEMEVSPNDPVGTQYSRNVTNASIDNGSSVSFSVSARNSAPNSLSEWNEATGTGHPAGPPVRASAPSASASLEDGATASLAWPDSFTGNGRDITEYFAAIFTGDSPVCEVTGQLPGSPVVPANSGSFKHVGTAESTTFSGLTPNTTYSMAVFAFNGMGCTRSVIVEATPRSKPGTVTSISSTGPEANGDFMYDFRLTGFDIGSGSTDADTFIYRLSGGGVEGGEHGPRSVGTLLESSNGSQYGEAISVEIRACKAYPEATLCSDSWSAPHLLGVAVRNSPLGGLAFAHEEFGGILGPPANGTYTWSSSPAGSYTSVTYSCGASSGTLSGGEGGSCAVTEEGALGGEFPALQVTITANGTEYVRTYDWNDYD